jgi:hypothetical protein
VTPITTKNDLSGAAAVIDTMIMQQGYAHMTGFEWCKTDPHDELVNKGAYCVAEPGRCYAVYLPRGGKASGGWKRAATGRIGSTRAVLKPRRCLSAQAQGGPRRSRPTRATLPCCAGRMSVEQLRQILGLERRPGVRERRQVAFGCWRLLAALPPEEVQVAGVLLVVPA